MTTWSDADVSEISRHDAREGLALSFAFTILTSAFLLFQVEPLISKVILPWFGGSPAVWTTCLLFFQTLLFLGYTYAHLTTRFCSVSRQAWIHLGLVALALVTLPIMPGTSAKPTGHGDPTFGVLVLLARSVGLPYFVLSATGPLVQGWFADAYPGRSPYRLYALSNVGSLLALLSYPVVFEPAFATGTQARLWSGAFVVFAVLIGVGTFSRVRAARNGASTVVVSEPSAVIEVHAKNEAAPSVFKRASWVALPAFASVLLLATTNHVCENVAVIPFLWVAPLALYLLSFIVAFDGPRWYTRRGFALAGVGLALTVGCFDPLRDLLSALGIELGFRSELTLDFAFLFVVCMLCHGELVRRRPSSRWLTEFYLWVAFGGALGGMSVSIVAPAIFSTFLEWTLGLLVAFVLAGSVLFASATHVAWRRRSSRLTGVALALLGCAAIVANELDDDRPLEMARNFYGTVAVYDIDRDDPAAHHYSLTHGVIVHGRQFRAPDKRDRPLAYYSENSGVGRALRFFADDPALRVGAVGLGVGTLAHYVHAGQHLSFYEINPAVVRLAQKHFSYLSRCASACDIVLGDARLSLEREPPQKFNVLVLDAFSGDAVPAHLLTREAFDLYLRHLEPDGVIAVNITNRQLDLAPVLAGLAAHGDLRSLRIYSDDDPRGLLYHADWILLTRNERFLAATPPAPPPALPKPKPPVLWTDSYSNLFQLLK